MLILYILTEVLPLQLIFTIDFYFFNLHNFGTYISIKTNLFNYPTFQVMMESIRAIIVCHRLGTIHLISFRRTVVRSYNSKTKSQTYRDVLSNSNNHDDCPGFFWFFWFVERFLEGRSFFVLSYDGMMVRQKEIKWSRL